MVFLQHTQQRKPFKKHHTEQLKLVSSFDWVNLDALVDTGTLIRETLADDRAREFVGSDRIEAIAAAAEKRTHVLRELAIAQQPSGLMSDAEGDAGRDTPKEEALHHVETARYR